MFGSFNNVKVRTFGERTSVPDDNVAKLMYYLSCVDTVINYNEIDRLSDYQNYDSLSVDDLTELFKLVILFNPEIFVEAGIFILDESLLPYDLDNQFFEITDERIGIHVNNEIFIGGRSVKVLKVMACNEDWLVRNYFRPWKNIFELTERYRNSQRNDYVPPPPPKPVYKPPPPIIIYNLPSTQNFNTPQKNNYNNRTTDSNSTSFNKPNYRRKESECCCKIF